MQEPTHPLPPAMRAFEEKELTERECEAILRIANEPNATLARLKRIPKRLSPWVPTLGK